ncbi:iron chelate uptake ABC transporter family permease subunit [Hymenobacter nivis]|uniref:iron chelate uptake ABC transporter family permease subunit n=1 Tax=Hymenobacter nivis TaxID=1850093 RepID=UPI001FEC7D39|nr:iron chelate uptake ABC transporter family permease subunit [Hymenobacter nivis]
MAGLLLPRLGGSLNLLALGEAQAAHLGLPVARRKQQLVVLATLAVGASVAVAGSIVFLGLVLPHLVRLAAGPGNRTVLPGSALGGAAVLVAGRHTGAHRRGARRGAHRYPHSFAGPPRFPLDFAARKAAPRLSCQLLVISC